MTICLENSKNGGKTCTVNNQYLHSKYNPQQEAHKFVSSIDCPFNPSCVLVLGPCLSYCAPELARRFPSVPLYAIQYDAVFCGKQNSKNTVIPSGNDCWSYTFLCTAHTRAEELSEQLFSVIGETAVFAVLLAVWQPSEHAFKTENTTAWQAVKLLLQKSRDVLATRSFFSKRWLKNSIRFCLHARNIYRIQRGSKNVLIAASGPSLAASLPFIKKLRKHFFVIALSSALKPLIHAHIYPDLCMSTDGGFYAQAHLKVLYELQRQDIHIPLAAAAESRIGSFLLNTLPVIPLAYGDGIETMLLNYCNIPYMHALRNGSVSGTAADFALRITSGAVYFCGLDLKNGAGYAHTLPNELESTASLYDTRLKPLASRTYEPESGALDIYRRWFSERDGEFNSRVFRLSSLPYEHKLGSITDILWHNINAELAGKKSKSGTDGKKSKTCACTAQKNADGQHIVLVLTKDKTDAQKQCTSFLQEQHQKVLELKDEKSQKLWYENCVCAEYLSTLKYPASSEFKQKLTNTVSDIFGELKRLCAYE